MRFLLACSLLLCSACGDDHAGSDAATPADAARPPDLAAPADAARAADDLSHPVDLAVAMDLAEVEVSPDLSHLADMPAIDSVFVIPPCAPNAGYGGVPMPPKLPPCGTSGNCNGHNYNLDCDGVTCKCTFDKIVITQFVQMQNTCNDQMNLWKTVCMF